jgi:hypothetical protein
MLMLEIVVHRSSSNVKAIPIQNEVVVTALSRSSVAASQQCCGQEGETMVLSSNTVAHNMDSLTTSRCPQSGVSNVGIDQWIRPVCNYGEIDHSLGQNNNDLIFLKPSLGTLPNDISDNDEQQITNLLLVNVDLFACYDYDVGLSSLMMCKLELLP